MQARFCSVVKPILDLCITDGKLQPGGRNEQVRVEKQSGDENPAFHHFREPGKMVSGASILCLHSLSSPVLPLNSC
ncbi:hypothetical protein CapIbe_000369 [Capra ibex]